MTAHARSHPLGRARPKTTGHQAAGPQSGKPSSPRAESLRRPDRSFPGRGPFSLIMIGAGAYAALTALAVGTVAFLHMLAGAFTSVGEWLARGLS